MVEILIRHARKEDCPALARVLIDATRDAFRGRVPDRCLQWLTPEESAANWAKNFRTEQSFGEGETLLVAESGASGVVGLALLGETDKVDPDIAARYAHELRSLQVNPAWQRQGVGRRLLARVGREVRRKGATHLLVAVLAENPNRAFYEHLGAVQLGARPYVWEGYETEEILYGWNDVQRQLT